VFCGVGVGVLVINLHKKAGIVTRINRIVCKVIDNEVKLH